jgi:hypothetical protein
MLLQLCYARGSVISCSLAFQTFDSQTDLIASPNTWMFIYDDTSNILFLLDMKNQSVASSVFINDVGSAVWWKPSEDSPSEACECQLEGEIHLPNDLAPSSEFLPEVRVSARLSIGFSLTSLFLMSSIQSLYFPSCRRPLYRPTIAQTVEIATVYASGPRPKAF